MNRTSNGGAAASPQTTGPAPATLPVAAQRGQSSARHAFAALEHHRRPSPASADSRLSATLPIRSIGPWSRARIIDHLLELQASDRYLRFG